MASGRGGRQEGGRGRSTGGRGGRFGTPPPPPGGRGFTAAPAGGSPGGFAVAHSGLSGGKLFGRGQEAVAYDREKEKGVLKVGPPPGQRFSSAWLHGLTNFPVAVDERPAEPDGAAASGGRVALSLRLERMQLTDREAGMVAGWCCEHADVVDVKKLWLFDNRLGDEGAAAVARILQAHPGMLEIHLSHNMLTLRGTTALLEALPFVIDRCHARLPWVSCQYQQPSEAQVLKAARSTWQAAAQQQRQTMEENSAAPSAEPASSAAPSAAAAPAAAAAGPLLLFPDTSALLPMLGAGERVALPTFFTLELLEGLAKAGRFGRALPPHEQVFLVVTDSVLKQLDGLKNDPGARPAVRRFLGQFLDLCGPAGHDFLTVLGAHEGEGLLVEHDAAVAGSRSADTKGQRADHRIVEVALFFQQEVGGRASRLTAASFPVLLLSGDNTQVQTGRSHGLPAARMADLAAAQAQLEAALAGSQPLTASLLRACLGAAAVTGLGTMAARSLQAEFDDAVAALQLATEALTASRQQLGAVVAAAAAEGPAEEAAAALLNGLAALCVLPLAQAADFDLLVLRQDWQPSSCADGACSIPAFGVFSVQALVPSSTTSNDPTNCQDKRAFNPAQLPSVK
ncbi:Serine threonine- kinase CTR1 isoform B [Chlorella sorokiniana]|uniref:Serine threonine-kinase CTR1 isoform B n=1 Tax=Chlorella sorokiniana TaxID=3076 RepID=A0A2P6TRD7_CHLSO|nr:Serine threonine- kinase CTR1 isoform B [Chlorella sorokiniana]|eukprot:PRW56620.1 Serine threonine- kinase CTR1 isoform B [Chlorella sorokiniana]